jgi:molybdopterin-guanine dinucleotide biosynthesis protein A
MIRQTTDNISGVILAGGAGSRFGGENKTNIVIDGEKIIDRIINTLTRIFDEIIIVTNTPGEIEQPSGFKITSDHFLNVGPLGGIHAAMKASSKEAVFIFAGDMPYLDKELIIKQIEFFYSNTAEAVLPVIKNYIEPLHGIYRNLLSERLDVYLSSQKEYAVRDFLKNVDVRYLELKGSKEIIKAFTNINTPGEARRLKMRGSECE